MSSSISGSKIKRYMVGFLLLVLFLFIFDRGLFYLIATAENKFYKDESFQQRFADYVTGKNYSTLIFGTSRTYEALHPFYFKEILNQNAYKEAQFGKNPRYNYHFYRMYKKYAGIPKVVIYGIDYFIFNSTSNKRWLARFNLIHQNKNPLSGISMLINHKKEVEDFLTDIIDYMKEKFRDNPATRHAKDFTHVQTYRGLTPKESSVVSKRPRNFIRQKYRIFPGKEGEYLKKLLDELDRDNVTVILVVLPDHYGTFRTNFNRRRMMLDLKKLTAHHDNAYIFNYNHPKSFPLNKTEYFLNGGWGRANSHLSQKGARRFNRIFLNKMKKIYQPLKPNV
jgi:hypothetical protein